MAMRARCCHPQHSLPPSRKPLKTPRNLRYNPDIKNICGIYVCRGPKVRVLIRVKLMKPKGTSSTSLNQPETAPVFIESGAKEPCLDTSHTGTQMLTRIRQLAIYPHGWDGADGKAPSQAAIRDAECFTRILVHDDIYAPSISLATDGEINFFWMLPHFRLDLGFYGDGTYSYYGMTTAGDEFLADEIPVSTPLPIQILQLIRKQ
jgi:hypothetical protein